MVYRDAAHGQTDGTNRLDLNFDQNMLKTFKTRLNKNYELINNKMKKNNLNWDDFENNKESRTNMTKEWRYIIENTTSTSIKLLMCLY